MPNQRRTMVIYQYDNGTFSGSWWEEWDTEDPHKPHHSFNNVDRKTLQREIESAFLQSRREIEEN